MIEKYLLAIEKRFDTTASIINLTLTNVHILFRIIIIAWYGDILPVPGFAYFFTILEALGNQLGV